MKKHKLAYSIAALLLTAATAITGYAAVYEWPNVGFERQTGQTVLYGARKEDAVWFSCADLEFKLGLEANTLAGITVLTLPKEEEGALKHGTEAVQKNDRFSREEINELCFVPAKDAATASFTLLPETEKSIKTTLSINLYENENLAPVIESGVFSTMKNMPLQGNLSVYDPDGDQAMIRVIEKPEKGAVTFSGNTFVYEPFYDMVGADSLTFVCVDKQGNYSRRGEMSINIEKDRNSFSYADMTANPSHYSALKLHEKQIMTGERIGEKYFFEPDRQVSRGEFLIGLNAAMGEAGNLTVCVNSGLQNDGDIPVQLKPYVKWARENKIITEKIWKPDEIPTRAEAVVLIDRALSIPAVKNTALSYPDRAQTPTWALSSYMKLQAYRMLDFYDGLMKPTAALKRDHMADLLWQVWKYLDAEN